MSRERQRAGLKETHASPQEAAMTVQGEVRLRAIGAGARASVAAHRHAEAALPPPWPKRP